MLKNNYEVYICFEPSENFDIKNKLNKALDKLKSKYNFEYSINEYKEIYYVSFNRLAVRDTFIKEFDKNLETKVKEKEKFTPIKQIISFRDFNNP